MTDKRVKGRDFYGQFSVPVSGTRKPIKGPFSVEATREAGMVDQIHCVESKAERIRREKAKAYDAMKAEMLRARAASEH